MSILLNSQEELCLTNLTTAIYTTGYCNFKVNCTKWVAVWGYIFRKTEEKKMKWQGKKHSILFWGIIPALHGETEVDHGKSEPRQLVSGPAIQRRTSKISRRNVNHYCTTFSLVCFQQGRERSHICRFLNVIIWVTALTISTQYAVSSCGIPCSCNRRSGSPLYLHKFTTSNAHFTKLTDLKGMLMRQKANTDTFCARNLRFLPKTCFPPKVLRI